MENKDKLITCMVIVFGALYGVLISVINEGLDDTGRMTYYILTAVFVVLVIIYCIYRNRKRRDPA